MNVNLNLQGQRYSWRRLRAMDLLLQRIELHGFEKSYDPEGDGDCFYNAAAFQLGRDGTELKNEMFDYLEKNQYDVGYHFIVALLLNRFA